MKWININDKRPLDDQSVFVWQKNQESHLPLAAYYEEEYNAFILLGVLFEVRVEVTHWMPLPNAPVYDETH